MGAREWLAFAQIGSYRLAEEIFGGGEVEDVVYDLEGEAEVAALLTHRLFEVQVASSDTTG